MKKLKLMVAVALTLFSASAFAQRKTIVSFNPILRYVDSSERDSIQNNINQGFVDGLKTYGRFRIIDGTTLDTTKAMIKKSSAADYDETNIIEAGKATNADYLCYSKVVKVGNQYNVYFNLLETQTGIPIGTYEEDCTYGSVTRADVVNRAVLKILEDDLRGTSSNPDTINSLKGSSSKSYSNPIDRDKDFKISFLPPAIKGPNAKDYGWIQEVLPGRMVNAFFTYSTITPLDIGTEATVIRKIRESSSLFYDEATIKEAGKLASAPFYIYTVITENGGDDFTFYAVLNHTRTGEAIATFRENCTFQQIRDKEESNIVNRMTFQFIKQRLGTKNISFNDYVIEGMFSELKNPRPSYALENIDGLGRELALQQRGISEKQVKKRKEALKEAAEIEKAAKKAEKKAARDAMWDARPSRGIDIAGGYYSNGLGDGKFKDDMIGTEGFVGTFALNTSFLIPNWLSLGCRADFMLFSPDTTDFLNNMTVLEKGADFDDTTYWAWDIMAQAIACFPIATHFAPYFGAGLGSIGVQTSEKREETDESTSYKPDYNYTGDYDYTFSFMGMAGLYIPIKPGISLHGEYILQYGGSKLGWIDHFSGGITLSLLGAIAGSR